MLALCGLSSSGAHARAQDEDFTRSQRNQISWPQAFELLRELERSGVDTTRARETASLLQALADDRERDARRVKDKAARFRARMLRWHVERIAHKPPRPLGDPGIELVYAPGEAWLAARALAPGVARARALIHALLEPGAEREQLLDAALRFAEDDARVFAFDSAEQLALVAHQAMRSLQTAELLARILTQRGAFAEAHAVLAKQGERSTSELDLAALAWWRARTSRAGADELERLRWLGASLTGGFTPALLAAACDALEQDAAERARLLARSLLQAEPTLGPALRVWGLAQLGSGPEKRPFAELPR